MAITKQILKKLKNSLLFPILLITGSSAIVLIFAVIYYQLGIAKSLEYSIEIFIGYAKIKNEIYALSIAEIIIKYVFSVTFIGKFLLKFLEPLNPIAASDYFIYDELHNLIRFRYWIMLPENNFLYDIHIRAIAMTGKEKTKGINALSNKFVLDDNLLEIARGVREVTLSNGTQDYPRILLDMLKPNGKSVYLIISATTENGKRLNYMKKYRINNMVKNCDFVSIRSTSFYPELEEKLFFRYQHFDKLYIKHDTDDNQKTIALKQEFPFAKDDILQESEFKIKQYGNKKTIIKDLYSEIISWYLNR